MKNKFVLESFDSYLAFVNGEINEDTGDFVPTLDFVKEYVVKLLAKQKEFAVGEDGKLAKYASQKNPAEEWFKNWRGQKKNIGKEYPTGLSAYYGASFAPFLWDKLKEEQKEELYKDLLRKIKKSGFDGNLIVSAEKQINNLIGKKKGVNWSPMISILPSAIKIEKPEVAPKREEPFTVIGIGAEEQDKVFKDNRWGSGVDSQGGKVNADAFQNPEVLESIKNTIGGFMKQYASGNVKINSIEIESSASRYRNTNEKGGKAENLSWGELSYNRAVTIAEIMNESAIENNIPEDKIRELQSKISIFSDGTNGDGTGGPNPPVGNRFGYYDENGKFIDDNGTFANEIKKDTSLDEKKKAEKNRSLLVIAELNEQGKPTGKYTTRTEVPKASPADYNQFRFVRFTMNAIAIISEPEITPVAPEKETSVAYKVLSSFPTDDPWFGGGGSKSSRSKKNPGKPGKGQKRRRCPEF
jgi:hypothetical protein